MITSPQVFFSNSSDALLHILNTQLQESQQGQPRARTVIITPNQLVKKNLQKQLLAISESHVVSGIIFLEFAPALIKLFRSVLKRDPRTPSKGYLSLQLEKILENYNEDPTVTEYLQKNKSQRIPPFAEELASLFLEYGKSARIDETFFTTWQGKLFQRVFETNEYPSQLVEEVFEKPKVNHTLHFFGFHHIPSVYHRFLKKLSQYFEINMYQISPTPEYWGDQTKFSGSNSILQSYGMVLRKSIDQITDFSYETTDIFLKPEGETALNTLKRSIVHVDSSRIEADHSIELHATPSVGRGVEVAYHRIAGMVMRGEAEPDDFLLLFNDIEAALPDLHRMFGSVEAPLPYQIYDVKIDSIFATFSHLLSLVTGRVSFDELIHFFECKAVQEHFGLTTSDIHQIETWLKKLHFRWGLSQEHRNYFLDVSHEQGSLEHVLHTLAYAFMKPQLKDSTDDNTFSPVSLETLDLPLLNALYEIKTTVQMLSQLFHKNVERSLGMWKKEFFHIVNTLLGKSEQSEQLFRFFDSLFEHIDGAYSAKSIFRFVKNGIEKKKGIYDASVLNGVLCAPLSADNIVSKKYIYLFGLEEDRFPKTESESVFEVSGIQKEYHPSRSDEAGAALLTSILHAREGLFLQYSNKNEEDGKAQGISPFLRPLIESLSFKVIQHDATRFLKPDEPMLRSSHMMAIAHAEKESERVFAQSFYESQLPVVEEKREWDLGRIRQFLGHPLRAYVQHTLGMYLERDEGDVDEKEFVFSPLDRYLLRKEGNITRAERLGHFPIGPLGRFYKEQLIEEFSLLETLLKQHGVNRLYNVHFRDDCSQQHYLNEGLLLHPSLLKGGRRIHGYLSDIADNILLIFDTPSNGVKYWGDILTFSQWKPDGTIHFLGNGTTFSTAENGLDELFTYLEYAEKTPSPLLPSLFQSFEKKDVEGLEKKIAQAMRGFQYEDPYLTPFFQTINGEGLLEKWHDVVQSSFAPYNLWVKNARI